MEAFQELSGWLNAPTLSALAERSWQVMQRRRQLLGDLPEEYQGLTQCPEGWLAYWKRNPVKAWIGERFFSLEGDLFIGNVSVSEQSMAIFSEMIQELVDFRLATYAARQTLTPIATIRPNRPEQVELPYFPNLRIACGHFKTGTSDCEEFRALGGEYGRLDPNRHFIAMASGDSMNGGKNPLRDGDYLLLELISSEGAGKITGDIMAIERQDVGGDNQYLLRKVLKDPDGQYRLRANNSDYADILVTEELREQFRTFARWKAVVDPLSMMVGQRFMREGIPPLFGKDFNPGSWNSGHVVIPEVNAHVLLVTLNHQGRGEDVRFVNRWIDERHFHWQSQKKDSSTTKRGNEIVNHVALGLNMYLFVRENRLENGKASPFTYYGRVRYESHQNENPMYIIFKLMD